MNTIDPDLNPIENLLSIEIIKLYELRKQYNSKANLWETFKTIVSEIKPAEIKI